MENKKVNNAAQMCSARKVCFYEGREQGEKVIEVENGCLSFTVLADRGLDIYTCRHKGVNVSFLTKGGLYSGEGSFNERFPGGLLYTCGLDTAGGARMPVHGKIHNIPAQINRVEANERFAEIAGEVRQCALFGEDLRMKRRIYTEYGSGKIQIETQVENCGYKAGEYCVLFHMNLGYPMLDSGVTIEAPVTSTQPRTPNAERLMQDKFVMSEPEDDAEEAVFFHTVKEGSVLVKNEKLKKAVRFTYDEKMLPHLVEWRSMISGDYALGIEPSTTTLDDDFVRKTLAPGKTDTYLVTIEIFDL